MDYLVKTYKEKCKNEFGELGFKTYRRNFYRVINDMFQSFHLHKSISGMHCTIEFIAAPLCYGGGIGKLFCSPDHLKFFEQDASWFGYDSGNPWLMDDTVDEMIGYMKKYLIPYFQKSSNSEQAYYATLEFQKNCYRGGIFGADPNLYFMALQAGLYDRALEHAIARKEHAEHAYKVNTDAFGYRPEYAAKMSEIISEINYDIKILSERNLEYIQRFIRESVEKSLLNLGIKK